MNNKEGADDDDDDDVVVSDVVAKSLGSLTHKFIAAESSLETSADAKLNWEANRYNIIEALEEKEKTESEEEREDFTEDYSNDARISNFLTTLYHVTHLKQFLMNKKVTVLEDL